MNQLQKNSFPSIEQINGRLLEGQSKVRGGKLQPGQMSFEEILTRKQTQTQQACGELKFSRHANERLASRNIDLSGEQMERLANGTSRAREKGIRESLVMVDNLAFIVNVKNNTVVTAVEDAGEAVFTNIDGAVIS